MNEVKLVKFNQDWGKSFEELKSTLIRDCPVIDDVVHIGSTAINELKAKNIVDIQILISAFKDFDELKSKLESLQFNYIDGIKQDHVPFHDADFFETGWEKRFLNGSFKGQEFNIHVRLTGSENAKFALDFVKLLESNADAKFAYSQFKQRLAVAGVDRKDYAFIKDSVIDIMSLLFVNNIKGCENEQI